MILWFYSTAMLYLPVLPGQVQLLRQRWGWQWPQAYQWEEEEKRRWQKSLHHAPQHTRRLCEWAPCHRSNADHIPQDDPVAAKLLRSWAQMLNGSVALMPCLGGLCICAPLCASHQSAPVPFPRVNTVSYPRTLTFINPRWNTVKGGIKLVLLNLFLLKNLDTTTNPICKP